MKRKVVLIVLSGWGIGENSKISNPFTLARMPAFDYIEKYFPAIYLQASGIAVGLPWDEAGNSEVGHLTIGSGRRIYQNYPKITSSIKKGEFFRNRVLLDFFKKIKRKDSALHLLGLFGTGHTHSSYDHLIALIKLAKEVGLKKVFLHLFGDGRDSPPFLAKSLLKELESFLREIDLGKIVSFSGRFFAMDRTQHWQRTKRVYDLLTQGKGNFTKDIYSFLEDNYQKGISDEFIEPTLITQEGLSLIRDDDGVFFFNFREDRMRQLFLSFFLDDFKFFQREKKIKVLLATMVPYLKKGNVPFAFSSVEKQEKTLSEIISLANLIQLKITETEKYPHLTYFFNGLRSEPFWAEERVLIPSYLPHEFVFHPEMRAEEITERLLLSLEERAYDFVLVNYPNAEAVGSTGNFRACLKAIETIDRQIGKILKEGYFNDYVFLITSDHGNIEEMRSLYTGEIQGNNTANPVPFYLVYKDFASYPRVSSFSRFSFHKECQGVISDIAPTILELFGLKKPAEMTGSSLLDIMI